MQFNNGEILISPKTIYWFEMPVTITDFEKIELLKKDIFLINYESDLESMFNIKDKINGLSAFFYNYDNIIYKNKIPEESKYVFSEKLIGLIKEFQFNNKFFIKCD